MIAIIIFIITMIKIKITNTPIAFIFSHHCFFITLIIDFGAIMAQQ